MNTDPIQVQIPRPHIIEGQLPHLVMLAAMIPGAWALAEDYLGDDEAFGLTDTQWFWLCVGIPIVHQLLVVIVWRVELVHKTFSRAFGDRALLVWGVLFLPLLLARPIALLGLGVADLGSLGWAPQVVLPFGVLLLVPAVYTLYSVKAYFGIPRALGGDHFFERYRTMPFVRAGAFRFSSNAMYTFAFGGLWGMALLCNSGAALAAALFAHAYIWVHWYCTEQPDITLLHGP